MTRKKILMIGPYPPPEGGWSTLIKEEREALESRNANVFVLNMGPSRKKKSDWYIRVFGAFDLLLKMIWFSLRGCIFRLHMNGDSKKGIQIVLIASLVQLLGLKRPCLSFHAGIDQRYFPHRGSRALKLMWLVVFNIPRVVICDCSEVREMILMYRREKEGVHAVSPFSSRRISFDVEPLDAETEGFLEKHEPVVFSYFAYRPEYDIEMLFGAFRRFKADFPEAGLIAFDDRTHQSPAIRARAEFMAADSAVARDIMLLGSGTRDLFLTVLGRADLYVRTPLTDGVCSSVLEALHLGVPVIAADNGYRPENVITFAGGSEDDLLDKLKYASARLGEIRERIRGTKTEPEDTVEKLVSIIEGYYWKRR